MSPNRIANTVSALTNAYYTRPVHAGFRTRRQGQAPATLLDWILSPYFDAESLSRLVQVVSGTTNFLLISEKPFCDQNDHHSDRIKSRHCWGKSHAEEFLLGWTELRLRDQPLRCLCQNPHHPHTYQIFSGATPSSWALFKLTKIQEQAKAIGTFMGHKVSWEKQPWNK